MNNAFRFEDSRLFQGPDYKEIGVIRGCPIQSFPLLDKNDPRNIFLETQFEYLWQAETCSHLSALNILKLSFHVKGGRGL